MNSMAQIALNTTKDKKVGMWADMIPRTLMDINMGIMTALRPYLSLKIPEVKTPANIPAKKRVWPRLRRYAFSQTLKKR